MAGEQQQPQQQQPEPPEAPPARLSEPGVGALLKASRLRLGQDLRDIAEVLRVRYVYMEAIEDGRYDALPGPTYASGFIRAYAEHLGLDSQEVVRRFKAETTGSRETANLAFPEPIPESGIPGGAIVLVGIVIAVVAYGAWYVNTGNGYLAELVAPLPQRLAHLVEGEGKPPGETTTPSDPGKAAAKPEPKTESTAEAKPEAKSEVKPEEKREAKPEAKPETTPETTPEQVAAAPPAGGPQPAPAASQAEAPSAASSQTPPTRTPPVETATTTAATPTPVPETRETPVATARAPEPATPVEPSIAPGNVPVDMIPAPRPLAPAATIAPATPDAPTPPATPPAAATSEPTMAAAATATPPTPTSPASGEPTRIVVRAKTNSWIQVRDETANELLVTRLLRSGDSYVVPNRDGLRLATGNAGALEILVDGAPVPAIGDDGAVRRNVLLDAEKLKAGQAVAD